MKRRNEMHDAVIESLTEGLLQLMEKEPFGQIKISELCARAGVSRVSFYRNFTSLQDILTKHLNNCTDVWWEDYCWRTGDIVDANFWPELLNQYKKNEKLIRLLYENNLHYLLKDHIFSCCGPKPEHDTAMSYTCAVIAGAIYGLVDEWIRLGMKDIPAGLNIREIIAYTAEKSKTA